MSQSIRSLCIRYDYNTIDFDSLEESGCTHINMGCSYHLLSDYTTTLQHVQSCLERLETTNLKLLIRPEPFMEAGGYVSPGDTAFIHRNSVACNSILEETEVIGLTFNDFSYNADIYDDTERESSTLNVTQAAELYRDYFKDANPGKLYGAFTSYGFTKGFEPTQVIPFFDIVLPEIYRITYNPVRDSVWLKTTLYEFLNTMSDYSGLVVPALITYDSDETHNVRELSEIVGDAVTFLRNSDGYCMFLWKYRPDGLYFPREYVKLLGCNFFVKDIY